MDEFPLTPNGKVDRKGMPAASLADFEAQATYLAPRTDTERKLVRLWEETLGVSPISVTANFFELGGRSVLAARLFTKILRTFGKELPLSTLFRSSTVEQLAKELEPSGDKHEYSTLVSIQPNGTKLPFFCIHGGAGSTLFLQHLARHLGSDQPFYGIEPEGMDGRRFQRPTVEQMAENYLSAVRRIQPRGPYFLGGYCFGGLVAFEMARILEQQGERVELLALFSAALRFHHKVAPDIAPLRVRPSLTVRIARTLRSPFKTVANLCKATYWRTVPVFRKITYQAFFKLGLRIPPGMRTMYVTETLGHAELMYRPKPYGGAMALFFGLGTLDFGPNLGWDGLAEEFHHHVVGDGGLDSRRDIMNEPLVVITAKKLAAYLNRTDGALLREASLSTN